MEGTPEGVLYHAGAVQTAGAVAADDQRPHTAHHIPALLHALPQHRLRARHPRMRFHSPRSPALRPRGQRRSPSQRRRRRLSDPQCHVIDLPH